VILTNLGIRAYVTDVHSTYDGLGFAGHTGPVLDCPNGCEKEKPEEIDEIEEKFGHEVDAGEEVGAEANNR
jgi:hypothetical protein